MKLWHLTQTAVTGYDTYDSVVVAAETVEAAKKIHPSHYSKDREWWRKEEYFPTWPHDLEKIQAVEIGEASSNVKSGLILASFNAG